MINIEIKDKSYNRLTFKNLGLNWENAKTLMDLAIGNGFDVLITKVEKESEDE